MSEETGINKVEQYHSSNLINKKIFWFGIPFLILLIIAVFFSYWYLNKDIVATINGEKITKSDLAAKTPQYKSFYTHSADKYSLDNLDAVVKSLMIEDKIIETEAKAREIVATQVEIDAAYKKRQDGYISEEAMLATAKGAYNWDKKMILERVRIEILKEKLRGEVLNSFDTTSFYVRYDYTGDESDPVVLENSINRINSAKLDIESGKSFEAALTELQADTTFNKKNSGVVSNNDLSASNYKDYFQNRTIEWDAIQKTKQGEYTEVLDTEAGYYTFYRVEKAGNGTYDSWEDFLTATYKKNNIEQLKGVKKTDVIGYLQSIFGTTVAYAHSGDFRGCSPHKSAQKGYVVDILTGQGVNGAVIVLDAVDGGGVGHVHDGSGENYPETCEDRHDTDTSHITGYYRLGTKYTYTDGKGPSNIGPEYMDCVYDFQKTITKAGYETRDWKAADFANGQTVHINYLLRPTFTLSTSKTGTGTGTLSTLDSKINCGSTCTAGYAPTGGAWLKNDEDAHTVTKATAQTFDVVATPSADSVFTSWGGACSGTGYCTVMMNSDKAVSAIFTKNPIITTTPTCNIAPASSSIESGGSVELSWSSANATSTTSTWSGVVTISGKKTVTPTSTTTYSMTATNSATGEVSTPCTATVTITITPPPLKACTIDELSTGYSGCATDQTGNVSTTVTARVTDAVSATLDFGNKGSTPFSISNGSNSFPVVYPYGTSSATATCTGADGVVVTRRENFYALDCPWRYCTVSIKNTIAEDTGLDFPSYIQTYLDPIAKYIKLDVVATFDNAERSTWDDPSAPSGGRGNVLSGNTDNPLRITQQVLFDRGTSSTIKPSKFGTYTLGVKGFNHGIVRTDTKLLACSLPNTIRVKHPACTAKDITVDSKSPLTPPVFAASKRYPKDLTFSSSETKGIAPDGGQKWRLVRTSGPSLTPIVEKELSSETLPQIKLTFSGDYSKESLSPAATRQYGPGKYRLTLLATSMADTSGNSVDALGNCYKTFDFEIVRGPEMKCIIKPEKEGVATQKITVSIEGDSTLYDNSFELIINDKKLAPTILKPGTGIFSGDATSLLKNAGKYYIAVEAKRATATAATFPNVVPCGDPTDNTPRYCNASSTGLCNYVVKNPDGGGGGEVAL
ncbi:MAG: hypothetical protein WCP14_04580 [bacterium]